MMRRLGVGQGSGPKNFVRSSINELRTLIQSEAVILKAKMLEIRKSLDQRSKDVRRTISNSKQSHGKDERLKQLLLWTEENNVTFNNLANETVPEHLTLKELQQNLERLDNLECRRNAAKEQVERLESLNEVSAVSLGELDKAKKSLDEAQTKFTEHLNANRGAYKFAEQLLLRQNDRTVEICEKMQNRIEYIELWNPISRLANDLEKLKQRLHKLLV